METVLTDVVDGAHPASTRVQGQVKCAFGSFTRKAKINHMSGTTSESGHAPTSYLGSSPTPAHGTLTDHHRDMDLLSASSSCMIAREHSLHPFPVGQTWKLPSQGAHSWPSLRAQGDVQISDTSTSLSPHRRRFLHWPLHFSGSTKVFSTCAGSLTSLPGTSHTAHLCSGSDRSPCHASAQLYREGGGEWTVECK